ncbi:MAG: hypothetical protein LUM44_17870 [Pyrinomonadaceae bacterium]|nr:hypothetical protein [Pyrinomonadaceae bacterium]
MNISKTTTQNKTDHFPELQNLFEKLDETNIKVKEIGEITHIGRTAEITITVYVPRPTVQSCPSLNKSTYQVKISDRSGQISFHSVAAESPEQALFDIFPDDEKLCRNVFVDLNNIEFYERQIIAVDLIETSAKLQA